MTSKFSLVLVSVLAAMLMVTSAFFPTRLTATAPHPFNRSDSIMWAAPTAASAEQVELAGVVSDKFTRLVRAGTRLYAGEDLINHGALTIFDISGGSPQRLARLELPAAVASIALSGTRVYLAVNPVQALPRLITVDVTDPLNPKQIGDSQVSAPGGISQVQVVGNLAYMTYVFGGFEIFNIADPANAVSVGGFFSEATALAVRGNRAYLSGGSTGFIILDISNPASPQLISRTSTGGQHIVIAGNTAYFAGNQALVIADFSDPLNVRIRATYTIPGFAQQVSIGGTRIYVAAGDQGLLIVDVSNADAPFLVGAYDSGMAAFDVQAANGLAYVASGGSGLLTVDAGDVARPSLIANVALNSFIQDVDREGNFLYVSEEVEITPDVFEGRLRIIDVSNPAAPITRGIYGHMRAANGLRVVSGIAYVTDDVGIQIIDVRNPTAPRKLGGLSTGQGGVTAVQVVGMRVYLSGVGMSIVDVSDLQRPRLLGRAVPSSAVNNMDVVGNLAYITAYEQGVYIVDVSNPVAPVVRGSLDTSGKALSVRVAGTMAYVADEIGGLVVIDVSNPAVPRLRSSYPTIDRSVDVQVAGDMIYLADQRGGVRILSAANPLRPTLVSAFDGGLNVGRLHVYDGRADIVSLGGIVELDLTVVSPPRLRGITLGLAQATGMQVIGGLAYVATGEDGLQIIDITNPGNPRRVGSYLNSTFVSVDDVRVVGNRAYILDVERGVQVLDVSDPSAPFPLSQHLAPTGGGALGASFELVGTIAYVGSGAGNFFIYDLANPTQPKLLSSLSVQGGVQDLVVANGMVYIAGGNSGFQIIDVHNPAAPALRGSYTTPATAYGVDVAGNLAYIADGPDDGLRILDVSNPNAPALRGSLSLSGSTQSVRIADAFAYVGNGAALKIVDIHNPAMPLLRAGFDTPGYIISTQRDGPLIYTAAGIAGLYILWYQPATTATVGPAGGTFSSSVDHTSYTIPTGVFTSTTTFIHTPHYSGNLPSTGMLVGIQHAFEVTAILSGSMQVITPSLPYTITITYSNSERGPAIAGTLALFAWDGSQWVKLPGSMVKPATNTITTTTDRIGLFAVLGQTRRVYLSTVYRQ